MKRILLSIFLCMVLIAIPSGKAEAEETDVKDEAILVGEISEQEAEEILEENEGNILVLYSNVNCKLIAKKDKGMLKVVYTVKYMPSGSNAKISPLSIYMKNGLSWTRVATTSKSKSNTTCMTGGFNFRITKFNTSYRGEATFHVEKNGKTSKYYSKSNTVAF